MAGLGPAIPIMSCPPKRDARDKRGHDDSEFVIAGLGQACPGHPDPVGRALLA
jgi:hypothetical protein